MKFSNCCLAFLCSCLFASCWTESTFYMSPLDVRANPYPTIPMAADSQKVITTASIAFQGGGSNDELRDGLVGGSFSVMQSHHFGHFQGYYGAVFGSGSYSDAGQTYYPVNVNGGFDSSTYSIHGAHRYYGYYGFNAGTNVVVPFGDGRGEWRAIGVDVAYRREFGQYLNFRQNLPADFIDLNAAYSNFFSLGGSSEIVGRTRHGVQLSYKVSAGGMLYAHNLYKGYSNGSRPYYISHTLAITKNRVTGYIQLTGGTHAFAIQTGVNISLRRKAQAFPPDNRPEKERRPRHSYRQSPPNPFQKHRDESAEHD